MSDEPTPITNEASLAPSPTMAMSSSAGKADSKELLLRRKEKELGKKEEQLKQSTAEIAAARESVDNLLQELEARELVMSEAELKHGSLFEREENAGKREAEVSDRERAVNLRFEEYDRKSKELEEREMTRKRDYEDRLFPLAAREQEIIRRETEVHALEVELESKLRAFSRKVAAEDERDRQKEKLLKDQESRLKDLSQQIDRRHSEAETLLTQAQDKSKAIKAEQVELESRDRDVKWRDDQLRVAHQEVYDLKGRLIKWERALAQREEELNLSGSEMQMQRTSLESKELELGERLSKLLAAEKELKLLEAQTTERFDKVSRMEQVATQRLNETADRESRISDEVEASKQRLKQAEDLVTEARQREAKAIRLEKDVEERERSLKEWIVELDFHEQQLKSQLALIKGGGGSSSSTEFSSTTSLDAQHNSQGSALLSGKHVGEFSLRQVQGLYIGATAQQAQRITQLRGGKSSSAAPTGHSSAEGAADRSSELAALAEIQREVDELESGFNTWIARYYCIAPDRLEKIFSKLEQQQLLQMLDFEARSAEEDRFLKDFVGQTIGGSASSSKSPIENFTTVAQWQQFFHQLSRIGFSRRKELLSNRVSRLALWNEVFQTKEETFADFPRDPRAVLKVGSGAELAPRYKRRLPKPTSRNVGAPAKGTQGEGGPTGQEERRSRSRSNSPVPDAAESATPQDPARSSPEGDRHESEPKSLSATHSNLPPQPVAAQLSAEVKKIIQTLPPYLRKYYEKEAEALKKEKN